MTPRQQVTLLTFNNAWFFNQETFKFTLYSIYNVNTPLNILFWGIEYWQIHLTTFLALRVSCYMIIGQCVTSKLALYEQNPTFISLLKLLGAHKRWFFLFIYFINALQHTIWRSEGQMALETVLISLKKSLKPEMQLDSLENLSLNIMINWSLQCEPSLANNYYILSSMTVQRAIHSMRLWDYQASKPVRQVYNLYCFY